MSHLERTISSACDEMTRLQDVQSALVDALDMLATDNENRSRTGEVNWAAIHNARRVLALAEKP